jgi:hypothetical protein
MQQRRSIAQTQMDVGHMKTRRKISGLPQLENMNRAFDSRKEYRPHIGGYSS